LYRQCFADARRPVQQEAALERSACRPKALGLLGEDDGLPLDAVQHTIRQDYVGELFRFRLRILQLG
jgi:hypothetical protein